MPFGNYFIMAIFFQIPFMRKVLKIGGNKDFVCRLVHTDLLADGSYTLSGSLGVLEKTNLQLYWYVGICSTILFFHVVRVGGDFMFGRFVPLIPFLFLMGQNGIESLSLYFQ